MTEQSKLLLVITVLSLVLVLLCFGVLATAGESVIVEAPTFWETNARNVWYTFEPKRDITTYELAKIMPIMIFASNSTTGGWEIDLEIMRLGTAARHFKRYPTQ